jgi:hypothetical protein
MNSEIGLRDELERLREENRQLRGERPLPAGCCPNKHRELLRNGLNHDVAVETQLRQIEADKAVAAEDARKESAAREALKALLPQAQGLLDAMKSAISTTN